MDRSQLLYQQALAFHRQGLLQEAQRAYQETVRYQPRHAPAWHALGAMAAQTGDPNAGLQMMAKALAIEPQNPVFLTNASNALIALNRFDEALALCQQALQFKPDHAPALRNQGMALTGLLRYSEAIEYLNKALFLNPANGELHFLRANALVELKAYKEASQGYAKAFAIDPKLPYLRGYLLNAKMRLCDWSDLHYLYRNIKSQVALNQAATFPFFLQAICDDEVTLLACAKYFTQDKNPPHASAYLHPAWPPHIKIRVGYLCGEFRNHATSVLMAEVWERHDKRQFEVFAFDNGIDLHSLRDSNIKHPFDHVFNISQMNDFETAELIFAQQIDILINLNGFTGRSRNNVFAMRPSPIQVNYLGFPGTIGAPYMDYLIADETVIPPKSQAFYTEKVVYLPDCYQPNDSRRVISKRVFTRQELGLPLQGFVFCCFNNNYKITPSTFDIWMRILLQVPGSVLWLLQDTLEVAFNLQQEATQRGVDAQRLVFAKRMPIADHLARHAMADLFLDTLPCNAHTTASDALWTGLPLLTLSGTTFPGRVAASLLKAVHCDDMVCTTVDEFEAKAIHLATHPEALERAKQALIAGKKSGPLYDSELFTRNLERTYMKMIDF